MTTHVQTRINKPREPRAAAMAGGVGGGTLLTFFANQLPAGNVWREVLLFAAPSVAVLLSALLRWFQTTALIWFKELVNNWREERKICVLYRRARKNLLNAMRNSETSEIHKENIRKRMESLEILRTNRDLEQIKALIHQTGAERKLQ
jgi:hypothetical protein